MDPNKPPGIRLGQIFTERAGFAHRNDFLTLPVTTPANVGEVTIEFETGASPDGKVGIVRIRIVTRPENNPTYSFDVVVTGLFEVDDDAPNIPMASFVTVQGPVMMFPFARQVVADLTWRGRFGPIWVAPINLTGVISQSRTIEAEQSLARG